MAGWRSVRHSSWADVRTKAVRIKNDGRVTLVRVEPEVVEALVRGDHGTYRSVLYYRTPRHPQRLSDWECHGCPWATYAFGRAPKYRRFEARPCAHVYATYLLTRHPSRRSEGVGSAHAPWREGGRRFWSDDEHCPACGEELTAINEAEHYQHRDGVPNQATKPAFSGIDADEDEAEGFARSVWSTGDHVARVGELEEGIRRRLGKRAASPGATLLIQTGRGEVRLEVEVAEDARSIKQGLQGREDLPEDLGMVFLPASVPSWSGFWMAGVPFPLSIAWWGRDGRILQIEDMEPCPSGVGCPTYRPLEPWWGALEVPLGWFGRRGVRPGDRVELLR